MAHLVGSVRTDGWGVETNAAWRSLLTQQDGYVTLRVTSRPGRIRTTGHVMTIVRNVLGTEACNEVGRIRMLPAGAEEDKEVRCQPPANQERFCEEHDC